MPVDLLKEKWTNRINTITIGATKAEGGTRSSVIKVGGETTLPFLFEEGEMPNPPVVAMEVLDMSPPDWPEVLAAPVKDVWDSPAKWAKKCVDQYKAQLICLRFASAHPAAKDSSPDRVPEIIKSVLNAVSVPLIIIGCGDKEKDNLVLTKASQAAKGERCLIGEATQDNYKTLTVSCMADGHSIINLNPLDINIEKQVNILVSDMGLPLDRIVMYPTTTALGYGMEYVYTLMERSRLAGLGGDKLLAMPLIAQVGQEVWRVKEARGKIQDHPGWGDEAERGPMWEATTALSLLQAGADILVMRHPKAAAIVQEAIKKLSKR